MYYMEGIWGRLPQSTGNWQVIPSWHRKGKQSSSFGCKVQSWSVPSACHLTVLPSSKGDQRLLALHKGDLPRLLALLVACQDVLLPPFRPPLKGTRCLPREVPGSLESGSSPLQQVRGLRISFQTGKRKQYLESFRKASTSRREPGSIKCFLSLSVFPCKIKCG